MKRRIINHFTYNDGTCAEFRFETTCVYIEGNSPKAIINFMNSYFDTFYKLYETKTEYAGNVSGFEIESKQRFKTIKKWILSGENSSGLYFEIKDYYKHDINRFVNGGTKWSNY